MITHWIISDPHLCHNNIIKFCNRHKYMTEQEKLVYKENYDGLKISDESTKLMNNDIIGEINDRAKPDDVIWFLGDVGFKNKTQFKSYFDRIVCKNKILIKGNHDDPQTHNYYSSCYDLVNVCIFQDGNYCTGDKVRFHWNKPGNITLTLCHYAMVTWDRCHLGTYHCYGHSHSKLEDYLNQTFPDRNSIDVGVDNIYRLRGYYGPVSHLDIPQLIQENKLVSQKNVVNV